MPSVTYVEPGGAAKEIDVPVGESVMTSAIANGIAGIVATCGGQRMCATCHVYVENDPGGLPDMSAEEDDMLSFAAADRRPNSRLSCQLVVSDETDGLVVHVPGEQV